MGKVPVSDFVDELNRETMARAEAVAHYARRDDLSPAEAAALDAVAESIQGTVIVDLGVGGGRTVPGLARFGGDYLGVDYTPEMIAVASRRFPGVRFRHGDARDLSFVKSGTVGLVFFSCCGLGMVGHDDRLRVLQEVQRVLAPGGYFAFSTHNLRSPDCRALFRLPEFEFAWNPARLAVRLGRYVKETAIRATNRLRFARRGERGDGYEVVNDACHDYRTMLYYVTIEAQRAQLEASGFDANPLVFDEAGARTDGFGTESSLFVVAQKS